MHVNVSYYICFDFHLIKCKIKKVEQLMFATPSFTHDGDLHATEDSRRVCDSG